MSTLPKHERVTYRGRTYLILWWSDGAIEVFVEFMRWSGLGGNPIQKRTKPGPTRAAVLALSKIKKA